MRRASSVHAAFVTLTLLLCTVYATADGAARNGAVVLSSLLPAAVISWRLAVQRRAGAPTGAWWWLLAGLAAFTAHNLDSLVAEAIRGQAASTGAFGMVTLVLGYVGLLAGATVLTMPYVRQDAGGMIDAMIVGLATASVVWTFLLHPSAVARGVGQGEELYRLLVVLLVSALAGAVARAAVTARRARSAVMYHLLAVTAAYAGIIAGALTEDRVTGQEVWWVRLCWITAYLALGAGAAHPSFHHLVEPAGPDVGRITPARLGFLGAALALNPLLAGVQQLTGGRPDVLLLSVGSLLLVPLVLARIAGLARLHARAEASLVRLATQDELTGLPNRRALTRGLELAVGRLGAGSVPGLVVLFCDLDDFKEVNDAHGHHVGDQLLVAVAHRLRGAVRSGDLVGRFGGDEFVIVVEGDPDTVERAVVAAVERALAAPVLLEAVAASAVASIGVATAGAGRAVTAEGLLSAADAAMYVRKRTRRDDERSATAERLG